MLVPYQHFKIHLIKQRYLQHESATHPLPFHQRCRVTKCHPEVASYTGYVVHDLTPSVTGRQLSLQPSPAAVVVLLWPAAGVVAPPRYWQFRTVVTPFRRNERCFAVGPPFVPFFPTRPALPESGTSRRNRGDPRNAQNTDNSPQEDTTFVSPAEIESSSCCHRRITLVTRNVTFTAITSQTSLLNIRRLSSRTLYSVSHLRRSVAIAQSFPHYHQPTPQHTSTQHTASHTTRPAAPQLILRPRQLPAPGSAPLAAAPETILTALPSADEPLSRKHRRGVALHKKTPRLGVGSPAASRE